jgi:hypothetical protein
MVAPAVIAQKQWCQQAPDEESAGVDFLAAIFYGIIMPKGKGAAA